MVDSSKERILVAMSGGVDSSVAACILHQRGAPIVGAYMKNWINEENIVGDCPWQKDIEDARAVAETIGIEFEVVNLMREYRTRVVDYLLKGYEEGVTPNPDVMCNREIKFGVFLDYALENGFEAVATGHYARRRENVDGSCDLLEGRDKNKDQSYFLALMRQEQIKRTRFPVGEMTKPEVRAYALQNKLPVAAKKDSQGICFIGQIKMSDFLKTFLPEKSGNIVDQQGRILGKHRGLHFYTLGQRKGIRVPSNTPNQAFVVVEKRHAANELVVGFDRPETHGLYATRCRISHVSFTNHVLKERVQIFAKPRYRAQATPIDFIPAENNCAEIIFHHPQRAITPGQVCALYDGEVLLGGGIFSEILC